MIRGAEIPAPRAADDDTADGDTGVPGADIAEAPDGRPADDTPGAVAADAPDGLPAVGPLPCEVDTARV